MVDNGNYIAANLENHIINANQDPQKPNRGRSPLETLIDEQVNVTCGDCHLYSAGANNRYADFRSSGCTSCHMEYSYDGRSRSGDPNVNRNEPANPDAIARRSGRTCATTKFVMWPSSSPEARRPRDQRPGVRGHHQGSNRTVLQFWGIRMDQNADVANNFNTPPIPRTLRTLLKTAVSMTPRSTTTPSTGARPTSTS